MFLRPLQCLLSSPAIGKRISRIPIKRLVRDIKYFYREQDATGSEGDIFVHVNRLLLIRIGLRRAMLGYWGSVAFLWRV